MKPRARILIEVALIAGLCGPAGLSGPAAQAQKPPAPAPPPAAPPSGPSSNPSGQPGANSSSLSQPPVSREDLVMFLVGRVATTDGMPLPTDAKVERMCNGRIRQQVFVNPRGDFSMELGSMSDSFVDASADGDSSYGESRASRLTGMGMGIPRRDLSNCELRASVSGFRSSSIDLVNLHDFGDSIDVGAIVVERRVKAESGSLSAVLYKAPKDARKAYEKGIEAKRNARLAEARQSFEKAVKIYPKFTNAWFQLGTVLEMAKQKDQARSAYTQATLADSKFLPPYLSLSILAFEAGNWMELLNLTNHILGLDPLDYGRVSGYIVDLDPLNYAEAYYYNAFANYRLNRMAAAEKSGLRAEYLDLQPRFPQLHLLLADIFARENNYGRAIAELQNYLDLVPQDKAGDQIRQRIARLQELNSVTPATEKSGHQ